MISTNPPAGLSEEQLADWHSEIQLFEEQYDRDFPSKIRYSFLILLYIILETRLRAACEEISKRKSLELKEKELRGTIFERSNTFLNKNAKLPSAEPIIWEWLNDFQKVRSFPQNKKGLLEFC